MNKKIIITGGTGLVGTALKEVLTKKGYIVYIVSRQNTKKSPFLIQWDLEQKTIELEKLADTYAVIHLAGTNIAEKRWTDQQKKDIISSRVDTSNFLYESFKKINQFPKVYISASGIGYYGADTGNVLIHENSPKGTDFVAQVCQLWEQAADKYAKYSQRVIKFRIGIVISTQGGYFTKIADTLKFYIGAILGKGTQYVSWIQLNDLCNLFLFAIENESVNGVYNAVADEPTTQIESTQLIAKKINKKILLLKAPTFILKVVLGELTAILIGGNKVSNTKITNTGFKFQYKTFKEALL